MRIWYLSLSDYKCSDLICFDKKESKNIILTLPKKLTVVLFNNNNFRTVCIPRQGSYPTEYQVTQQDFRNHLILRDEVNEVSLLNFRLFSNNHP